MGSLRGQQYETCERLLNDLAEIGLYIVRLGELESFARQIGLHGPAFAAAALEAGVHSDMSGELAKFINGVAASFP